MADDVKGFALRMPPALYAEVVLLSEQDRRSINAEIVVLLEKAISARRAKAEQPAQA